MPSFILSCLHHAGRRCALQLVHRTASGPFLSLVNPWGHATHPAAATTASRNHHVRILRLCPMHLPQSKHGVRTYTHAYMYSSTHLPRSSVLEHAPSAPSLGYQHIYTHICILPHVCVPSPVIYLGACSLCTCPVITATGHKSWPSSLWPCLVTNLGPGHF